MIIFPKFSMNPTKRRELLEIRSEEIQEVISKNPSWILKYGIILTFFTLFTFIVISWFVKYPNIVIADVVITSTPAPDEIESKIPGTLSLLKKDNDSVRTGEPIAYIKSDLDPETIIILERSIESYLKGELDFGDLTSYLITHSSSVGSISEHISSALSTGIHEESLKKHYAIQLESLKRRLSALKEYKVKLSNQLGSIEQIADSLGVSKSEDYAEIYLNIAIINYTIIENQFKIDDMESQIADLKNEQTKSQKEINIQSVGTMRKLLNQIRIWKEVHLLIAPKNGNVIFQEILQDNSYVEPGHVFTVIPSEKEVIALAKIPIASVVKIKKGQAVNIQLKMYPSGDFGVVQGIVESVSTVPKQDHIQVFIRLPKGIYTTHEMNLPFSLNLNGKAEFILDDQRLIERLTRNFKEIL